MTEEKGEYKTGLEKKKKKELLFFEICTTRKTPTL